MKTASSAETGHALTAPVPRESASLVWVLASASVLVIVLLYFFVFRAAHTVQIREVPLTTKGGRP